MATLTLHRSPFGGGATETHQHNGSLIDWLQDHYPNGFGVPITVTLNGDNLPLENLDIHLLASDEVVITVQPAGAAVVPFLINALVAIAISYVVARVFGPKQPKNPAFAATPQPSPIYSVAIAQNATRLSEAIPVLYGEVMTTPDYASQPYLAYTEVVLIDTAVTPGYVVEYFDNTGASLGTTAYPWTQMFLFFLSGSGSGWYPAPTGSASPGLIEGTYRFVPALYGVDEIISPSSDRLDPGALDLSSTAPPGTLFYQITNDQAVSPKVIQREAGDNGDQYLCALMCVGCGEFESIEAEDIRIGNTTLDLLEPETYTAGSVGASVHGEQIGPISFLMALATPPGVPFFWENVITALEVGDQELTKDTDETLYFPLGDREVFRIVVDVGFPRGLYKIDSGGAFDFINVTIGIDIQLLVGSTWTDFQTQTVTFNNEYVADVSPFRRSLSMAVSPGIYRVRIRRTTPAAPTDGTVSDAIQWLGLRGFIATNPETNYAYGDCTMLALRIRANSLISEQATSRIQARARRLLPSVGFTQSPSYCVADVMTNTDYGAARSVFELDTELFLALEARWSGEAKFNGGFTERITVWDALGSVLGPGVAEPMLIGGLVSARYEGERDPVQIFNDANIVQGSLSRSFNFKRVGENDGFTVEYRNPDTWQPAYVTYPESAINPEKVGLFGITDVNDALLYARFLHQRRIYTRQKIRFDVELEGNLPVPGDMIKVQESIIHMSQGGRVISYNEATRELTLENPISLVGTKVIILRDEYGVPTTGYHVTLDAPTLVTLATDPDIVVHDATADNPTLYAIGLLNTVDSNWLIDSISPSGQYTFTIEASNYDQRIYEDSFPFLTRGLDY